MKGVSDNSPQKKMGNNRELKKPLQVLQLNKKDTVSNNIETNNNNNEHIENNQKVIEPKGKETLTVKIPKKNSSVHFESSDAKINPINPINDQDIQLEKPTNIFKEKRELQIERTVDDFDFDENEFLEALNHNEPIGLEGETIKGKIIAIESDGLYVDIGGKAPGFMPKKESGIGVITNFKEKFPIGDEIEVLVIKEQNADGMVTVSARALILRKSWEKVNKIAQSGELVDVLINGSNRGGLTCDVEGLRGFIPRSQLENGTDYQSLLNKIIKIAFLEVNPETKKLVLSEKKASLILKFTKLKLGQLIEGEVLAIKPYGFFIDLGGASGLLHQSSVTSGSIRNLREIFTEGEIIKALVTEIDLDKGRIGLNTALLENSPGEILIEKSKIMNEATLRAAKTQALFDKNNN